MKIYKIAQDFQMITQNPAALNDPDVQLQNLQNAQAALEYFSTLVVASQNVASALNEMEEALGLGDLGLSSQFADTIKQAAMQTPAFNLLAQMNLVSSIDNLLKFTGS